MHGTYLLLLVAIAAWIVLTSVQGRTALRGWAKRNQLDLLEFHSPALCMPWRIWLATRRNQQTFKVKVFDPATRRIRTGWVRFDSSFGFPLSDPVDVTWDGE